MPSMSSSSSPPPPTPPPSSSPSPSPSTSNNNHSQKKRKRNRRLRLDKEHSNIVIVGSGLAGLSAAISLEQAGFSNIAIYERDSSLEVQKEGYGLTLTYNPKGPLASLGILEIVAQQDCPSRSHYVFRPDGSILGYFGNAFFQHRGLGQRGNLRVPRKVLRKILVETLQHTTIHWNHQFVNARPISTTIDGEKDFNGYILEFTTHDDQHTNNDNGDDMDNNHKEVEKKKIVEVNANVVVAADGIRSSVLKKLVYDKDDRQKRTIQRQQHKEENMKLGSSSPPPSSSLDANSTKNQTKSDNQNVHIDTSLIPDSMGLRRMGVRLILGIADFTHPLLQERGFYTLDGKHRLFTMPYQSDRFYLINNIINNNNGIQQPATTATEGRGGFNSKNRIMWQLSLATPTTMGSDSSLEKEELQKYVLETCRSWHSPVVDMIQATPLETIWGTDLMDRDPKEVLGLVQKHKIQRLVAIGDALHSMSPFKGQGANQALADGPLLADWLGKATVDSAIVSFWRETVQRTAPVVAASRKAARELHSETAISNSHGFAGIQPGRIAEFTSLLETQHIGAYLGKELDQKVAELISEYQMGIEEDDEPISVDSQKKALQFASVGDTQSLRILSLAKQSKSIRSARDGRSKSCLHLAVENGHVATCKWLITEVGCDFDDLDQDGKRPVEYASNDIIKSAVLSLFSSKYLIG